MELYLHSPHVFMACCLVKHRDNFTLSDVEHWVCGVMIILLFSATGTGTGTETKFALQNLVWFLSTKVSPKSISSFGDTPN